LKIIVDVMGGDYAPTEIVKGCIDAINIEKGFNLILVGVEKKINEIISDLKYDKSRIEIKNAEEVIKGDEVPTVAIKKKKNSSMVVGFNLLKENAGDAFLSAGNSGALLTGSLLLIGRLKGVIRPALAAIIPAKENDVLLIDAGLNSMCKPESYVQFAKFGTEYMKCLYDIEKPKVGLINIGSENNKGNTEVKEAHELLLKADINYRGNIEGNEIPMGKAHVIVCNGFLGNILLKFLEGTAKFFFGEIKQSMTKNFINKIGGAILRKDLKAFAKRTDADAVGGAPILGVEALVIKSHGNSTAKTIKNVLLKTKVLIEKDIIKQIKKSIQGDLKWVK